MIRLLFILFFLPAYTLGNSTSDSEIELLKMANAYVAENIVHLEIIAKELKSQPLKITEIPYTKPDIRYTDDGIFKEYTNPPVALVKVFQETNIFSIMRSQKDDTPTNDYLRIHMGTIDIQDEKIGAELIYKISSTPKLGCTKSTMEYYKHHCIIHLNNQWYLNYSVRSK